MFILDILIEYISTNGWLMLVTQVVISVTGVPAIIMSQSLNERVRKYACLVAISGQPFWFMMAWMTGAWGVFFMCFFYTYAWAKGVWNHWIDPWLKGKNNERFKI
jgi:hypothetical protein